MNRTEKSIMKFYQTININDPLLLSIEIIVDYLDVELIYWNNTSAYSFFNNRKMMFINESINDRQQWQEFGHEMSHYFNDESNRKTLNNSFVDYCETKADYFAYHFCVPTFMLQKIEGVDVYGVMELFNVEFDFALRRLEMYKSKCLVRGGIYETS